MSSEMQVRNFHCNNCGAPLQIPKGSKGRVVCPSCRTECVIEGLVKNSEIQAKENINSGIALTAEIPTLHQCVVEALTKSPCMPLDILEKVEITKEEHLCVPAYLFYCNASASFTYEAGNMRQHKTAIDLGNKVRVEKENYVEWTQMSSSASITSTMVASGNREFDTIIQRLYLNCDPNQLVDVEELEFPFDVNTYSYNLPQAAAFNQYIKPSIEKMLENKAVQSLNGKTYRNISLGGSNVQKDEMIRVFLGIYHVVYTYNNQEYSLYITGNGKRYACDKVPVDPQREAFLNEKQRAKNALTAPKSKLFGFGILVCVLLGCFIHPVVFVGAALLAVLLIKKNIDYKNTLAAYQKELDDFTNQAVQAKRHFLDKDRPLKGIYSPYGQEL